MVAHDSINIFGGFAPFPNTIMIPTMGLQSDVIGFRFGFGYEKGKRTLRAMSNEQFNTLNEEAEQAIYKEHDTTAINFFKLEIDKWTQLQNTIVEKSVEIEIMKAQRTPSAMAEIIQTFNTAVQAQGANITWENLAATWNDFFGGGQTTVFNINSDTSTTPTTITTSPNPTADTPTTTTEAVILFYIGSNINAPTFKPSKQQTLDEFRRVFPQATNVLYQYESGAILTTKTFTRDGVNMTSKKFYLWRIKARGLPTNFNNVTYYAII